MGFSPHPIPFLQPLNPQPTNVELAFLHARNTWLASPNAAILSHILHRIIQSRGSRPISNIIILSLSRPRPRDFLQFALLSQIAATLSQTWPHLLNPQNIVFQDPLMAPEMRELFENHGCTVLPLDGTLGSIWDLVGEDTMIFAPFAPVYVPILGLLAQGAKRLGIWVGSDLRKVFTKPGARLGFDRREEAEKMVKGIFEEVCGRAVVPAGSVMGEGGDEGFRGLKGLEIWWRPEGGYEVEGDDGDEGKCLGTVVEGSRGLALEEVVERTAWCLR